jgi:hypothetical protein
MATALSGHVCRSSASIKYDDDADQKHSQAELPRQLQQSAARELPPTGLEALRKTRRKLMFLKGTGRIRGHFLNAMPI